MLKTSIGRLRAIGMAEGLSFILLLFVAMPLKYMANMPIAVTIVGAIHGVLFLAFLVVLFDTKVAMGWGIKKALVPFVAALLPFGPFVIDRRLREEEQDAGG